MVKIVWTEQSVLDIKEIFHYISKDSKRYTEVQIRCVKSKTAILKTQPECGRIVPELGIAQIRELIEGNIRIVYRLISNQLIEIMTIHHSARDFESREIGTII